LGVEEDGQGMGSGKGDWWRNSSVSWVQFKKRVRREQEEEG